VGITRRCITQLLLQPDLPRCRIEQVRAAHDVGDALSGVVDDHGQLVGVLPVGAFQHKVADLALDVVDDPALDAVGEINARALREQALGARRASREQALAAGAGINRTVDAADRRIGDFPAAAGAGVHQVAFFQDLERGAIDVIARTLVQHRFVPVHAEGFQRPQDRVGCAGHGTLPVDVVDAQQPGAPVRAGVEMAADSGHQRSEMQGAAG